MRGKKIIKSVLWIVLSFFGLCLLISVTVYIPPVQKWLTRKATTFVSDTYGIEAQVGRISVIFPDDLSLTDVLLFDHQHDTMIYARHVSCNISVMALLRRNIHVSRLQMDDAAFNLLRLSAEQPLNIELFTNSDSTASPPDAADPSKEWAITLRHIDINRSNFLFHDVRLGMRLKIGLGEVSLRQAALKLSAQQIPIKELYLNKSYIRMDMMPPVPYPEETDTTTSRWVIELGKMVIGRSSFSMSEPEQSSGFDVLIGKADLTDGVVDVGKSLANVGSLSLDHGSFLQKLSATATKQVENTDTIITSSASWLVQVNKLQLSNSDFALDTEGTPVMAGFDPNHIRLTNISADIDSFVNYGLVIKGDVQQLQLRHSSGFAIEQMRAGVRLDSTITQLSGMQLQTEHSEVNLDLKIPVAWYAIDQFMKQEHPLSGKIKAAIGIDDLLLLYPDQALKPFAGKVLNLESELSGTSHQVNLKQLVAALPGTVQLAANGTVSVNPHWVAATDSSLAVRIKNYVSLVREMNLSVNGRIHRMETFLPPDTAAAYVVPSDVSIKAQLYAGSGIYRASSDVLFARDKIHLSGYFDATTEEYRATVATDSLILAEILPGKGTGALTFYADAAGKGLLPESTRAEFGLQLGLLEYAGFAYRNINLQGTVDKGQAIAVLSADNEALKLKTDITASFASRPGIVVAGIVELIDLHKMGFSETELSFGTQIDAQLEGTMQDSVLARVNISKTHLKTGKEIRNIEHLSLKAYADSSLTTCDLLSDDMQLSLEIFAGSDHISQSITALGVQLPKQIADGSFAFLVQPDTLPHFNLQMTAKRNNALAQLLRNDSIKFNGISLKCFHNEDHQWDLNMFVEGFSYGSNYADSIRMQITETNQRLDYTLRAGNISGKLPNLRRIVFEGYVAPHDIGTRLNIQTPTGRSFVDVSLNMALTDTATTVRIVTGRPVFGTEWEINPQNFFTYKKKEGLFADLHLVRGDEEIRLSETNDSLFRKGSVALTIRKLNLGAITDFVPAAPLISGTLNTDLLFALRDNYKALKGTASVDQLAYQKKVFGDVMLDAFYLLTKTEHHLKGDVDINGKKTLWAKGSFSPQYADSLLFEAGINALDLSLAEAFSSGVVGDTRGTLDLELTVKGSVKKPDIDGRITVNDAVFKVLPTNTSYVLGTQSVAIDHNLLHFDKFSFTDPADRHLVLDGLVNLTDPLKLTTDLSLKGSGIQLSDAPKDDDVLFYGKALADINVSLKGDLLQPLLRGKIAVLENTDLTYIMRDHLDVKQEKENDVVRFRLPVADSIHMANQDVNQPGNSLDMLVEVDISELATFVIGLSEDMTNYIAIQGGGTLTYTLTPNGYQSLSGKYEVHSGKVAYHPPVISEKIFTIEKGGYLNWNGDIANPEINITAVQRVRLNYTNEEKASRMVNFDVYVLLNNTLNNLNISFNLEAKDTEVAAQLATATPEEITAQVMNIMVTNSYSPAGSSPTGLGDNLGLNALNSLISKQLNVWVQNNLKGVDLTFNVESYTTQASESGQDVTQTDFAYQFSKKILNDRGTIRIGGHMGVGDSPDQSIANTLVDDMTFEYALDKRERKFLKVFRQQDYQDVLEGYVTKTGAGIIFRKQLNRLGDLFRKEKKIR